MAPPLFLNGEEKTMSIEGLTEGKVIGHGDVRQVSYGDNEVNHYEWTYRGIKSEGESIAAGRAIFKQRLFCYIHLPGGKNIVPKEFKEETPEKLAPFFAMHPKAQRIYQLWKAGNERPVDGTPIDLWPGMDEGQREEFKAQKIYTIEQVASLSDLNLQTLGPSARGIRNKARIYLDNAKNAAASEELDKLRAELAEMRAQMLADKEQKEIEKPAKKKKTRDLEVIEEGKK